MGIEALQLVAPVIVFTAIVVALSLAVLAARSWLAPSGSVQIVINGHQKLTVASGGRLLWTLARQAIYLPAACGGRGSCGQCRVIVRDGCRPLLPNESNHINRREASEGMRLACMFTVREDLTIEVDRDLLEAKQLACVVESTRFLAPFLKELVLRMPTGEWFDFEAGDYVLIEAPPHDVTFSEQDLPAEIRDEWRRVGLLGTQSTTAESALRAYSLANAPGQGDIAELIVRFAAPPPDAPPGTPPGQASSYLFGLKAGDTVTLSGPFGDFHARDGDAEMILIAGGAGLAPIRSIILDQLARGTERRLSFWYGVRTARDLCYQEEFDALAKAHSNFSWSAAVSIPQHSDGWQGPTGLIHTVVYERYLERHPAPEQAEYYLCGPPLMSAAIIDMLDQLGVPGDRVFYDDFGNP